MNTIRVPRAAWINSTLFLTISFLSAGPATAQSLTLNYRPAAAEYSATLDRIVLVSASPNQLHVLDPVTQVDVAVNLPSTPLSLSISPDGYYAAVGHDAAISYVNLNSATLSRLYATTVKADRIVLTANWVHAWPAGVYYGAISVNLFSGASSSALNSFFPVTGGRYNAAVNAIYGTRDGTSPNDVEKFDVSTGPITSQTDSVYHGDYPACGGAFISPDGSRIYTGCASVYHASTDASLDMRYLTSLASVQNVMSLAESAATKLIAILESPSSGGYGSPAVSDRQVTLLESTHLGRLGVFALTDFAAGPNNYAAHGKWVFLNSAGTSILVVKQADASSNLLNDFAVQTIPLSTPVACGAAFASATTTVTGDGVKDVVQITADRACRYEASTPDSWISILSGGYGSGDGTLTYLVRPNTGNSSRTGTITLAGSTFTITQNSSVVSTLLRLPDSIIGVDYAKPQDRMVFISASPNELHYFDPVTRADRVTSLQMPPLSVSVRPDGLFAAVGHDGWVSLVNLTNGAVTRVYQVITDVHAVILASNGYAYLFPARAWSDIYSLKIDSGNLTAISAIYDGREPRLTPDGKFLYVGGDSFSKWDISNGLLAQVATSGSYSSYGPIWLSADGTRLFSAGAKVFRTSSVPAQDVQYAGQFGDIGGITWAAQSPVNQTTAVIPTLNTYSTPSTDTELRLYGDAFLGFAGKLDLPRFTVGANTYAGHGRWAFWNNAQDKLHVIEKADDTAKLLSPWAIWTVGASGSSNGCTYSLNRSYAAEPAGGGYDSISVTTGSTCVWTASSPVPWLTLSSGSFGFGSAGLSFSASPNLTNSPRTAQLTIAGLTVSVTQAGVAVGTSGVTPAAASGWSQTLAATYTAQNGNADISFVQLLAAVSPDGGGKPFCFVHYDARGNGLWMYGDSGFFVGPVAPGASSNLLQNTLCAVNTSTSSSSRSGSFLTLNVTLVSKAVAERNIYQRGYTGGEIDTGWVQQGTWSMTAAPLPTMSSAPAAGSGSTPTFSLTYPDAAGFPGAKFGWVQFLVAAAADGGGQPFCFVHYDRAGNGLWMYSSDVGFFLGPVAPGTASNALSSSACSVNTAGVTVANTNGSLLVTVPLNLKAPMSGAKLLFQRTLDLLNRDTGMRQSGTWTIP